MYLHLKWPKPTEEALLNQLSRREFHCLCLIALGYTAREIASTLGLSNSTVEHYADSLKSKLGCTKRSSIITRGIELRLMEIRMLDNRNVDK